MPVEVWGQVHGWELSTNSKEEKILGQFETVFMCFLCHIILRDWSPNQFNGMIRWWSQYHVWYMVNIKSIRWTHIRLCWYIGGDYEGGAHDESIHFSFLQMFGINSRFYPTSIDIIMSRIGLYSCKGVHLNNTHISFEHICSHIWWDHKSPWPFPLTCWGWFPPFVDDFHPETKVILN
jgi:hypothetical protein